MDAHELKPEVTHATRPLVVRLAAAWLALLLAVGLWQGFGAWLLSGAGGHVA
jgi:hypothetical protein